MSLRSFLTLLGCLGLCFAVAGLGALVTTPEIPGWYAGLVKPAWTPPNWLFPVAWNLLYALMAIALWRLIDRTPPSRARQAALAAFGVQLALNAAWSPVFFKLHAIGAGLLVIGLMWIAIAATIRRAWPIDRLAGILLLPYLVWVTYATTLNAGIWAMNR